MPAIAIKYRKRYLPCMKTTITYQGKSMITCQTAAERCGCSMGYIRRLAREGKLEATRVGRTYLIEEGDAKRLASQKSSYRKGFCRN